MFWTGFYLLNHFQKDLASQNEIGFPKTSIGNSEVLDTRASLYNFNKILSLLCQLQIAGVHVQKWWNPFWMKIFDFGSQHFNIQTKFFRKTFSQMRKQWKKINVLFKVDLVESRTISTFSLDKLPNKCSWLVGLNCCFCNIHEEMTQKHFSFFYLTEQSIFFDLIAQPLIISCYIGHVSKQFPSLFLEII